VEVGVTDRLPRCLTDVDAEIDAVGLKSVAKLGTELDRHLQRRRQLVFAECEKVGFVTPWHDERVPRSEWRGVKEGDTQRCLTKQLVLGSESLTKRAFP
jgi:hypothetical protein